MLDNTQTVDTKGLAEALRALSGMLLTETQLGKKQITDNKGEKFREWLVEMSVCLDDGPGFEMTLDFAVPMVLDMASFSLLRLLNDDVFERRENIQGIIREMLKPGADPTLKYDVILYAKFIHGIEDYKPRLEAA